MATLAAVEEPRRDRTVFVSLGVALVALVWRVRLAGVYMGHEEEDWGNLEIIRGVLDSHFAYVETEHMPLFVWLAAAVARITGDVHLAALIVPVVCGAAAVGLTTWIGMRWLGPAVGVAAGLAMCLQPESALYSASPLRESLYVALMMGGILLVGRQQLGAGAAVLAVAFLARFNVAFSILPALLLWAALCRDRTIRNRALVAAAAIGAVVIAWAAYYHSETGSWAFWGRVVELNTGDAVADLSAPERITAVVGAVGGLFGRVLPSHVGWLVVPLAVVGGVRLVREPPAEPEPARWLGWCALGTLGLLALTALVSTYEWHHNLYWKWLTPSVPFLLLFAAYGAAGLLRRAPRRLAVALVALIVVITGLGYGLETHRQVTLSDQLYGTQVRLARWLEQAWEPEVGVLTDGIASSWLHRRHGSIRVFTWRSEGLPKDDPEALGAWLIERRVGLVMWFSEEWFGAVDAAGYLAGGQERRLGPARLVPIVRETGYGMIAWQVVGPGVPEPDAPPPQPRSLP
jgi:hypothetical protein